MTSNLESLIDDDQQLWKRVLNGDSDAFSQLYRRYQPQILSFLLARCRGRVSGEDLASEVWIRVLKSQHQFDGKYFRAWVFQIARNLLSDQVDSADQRKVRNTDTVTDQIVPQSDETQTERLQAMRSCLIELGGDFVKVLLLQLDGNSSEQIAEAMEIPMNTVYSRTSRGKALIKDCVEKKLS